MKPNTLHIVIGTLTLAMASGCAVIRPGESARIFRPFSEGLDSTPMDQGLHAVAPWNTVVRYDTQLQTQNESVVVLTKDDLKIAVDASVILRPVPETVHLLEAEIGANFYDRVVQPKFRTSIRNVLATYSMVEISKNTRQIEAKLEGLVTERLEGRHIYVHDVIIDDVRFSQAVLDAIERKVATEQQQEQMVFQTEIAKRKAEITRINAQAEAEATLIRADAQAKAQSVIDGALTPRYLQYKALESPSSKYFFMPTGKDGLPVMLPVP